MYARYTQQKREQRINRQTRVSTIISRNFSGYMSERAWVNVRLDIQVISLCKIIRNTALVF